MQKFCKWCNTSALSYWNHCANCGKPLKKEEEEIKEVDYKQWARESWASSGLIKFPPNLSKKDIDDFLSS